MEPKRRGRPPMNRPTLHTPTTLAELTQRVLDKLDDLENMLADKPTPVSMPSRSSGMQYPAFCSYVRENGSKIIAGSYPGSDGWLIETIWSGVPVINGPIGVRMKSGEWVYL